MPYDFFKQVKIKCNSCNDIIFSDSDIKWTECSCGETKVLGKSFLRIKGKNYTNLSILDSTNVPDHNGWNDKPSDYYKEN